MKRFLALSAVLLVLLRPLCEVQAAGFAHGEPGPHTHATTGYQADEAVPCCAVLDDGSLAPSSVPALALGAGDGKLAFAAPVLTAVHYAGTPGTVARHTPGVLLPSLSFYARSARIRR
jgi:hypothetical protein